MQILQLIFKFFFHFPVKPLPPSNVGAELTRNVGLLNVSWTKPVFASRDLTFQIRWNSGNRQEIPWQVLALSPGLEQGSLLCCPVGWSCFFMRFIHRQNQTFAASTKKYSSQSHFLPGFISQGILRILPLKSCLNIPLLSL